MTTLTLTESQTFRAFAQVFGKAYRAGWEVNTPSGALPPDDVIETWVVSGIAEDVLKRSYLTPLGRVTETLTFYREGMGDVKKPEGKLVLDFSNAIWTASARVVKREPIAS